MKKQRVLIVGFGFMGEMHAQALLPLPAAEIVGLVDVLPDVAKARAAKLGLTAPVFNDLAAALRKVAPDIVNICLPTDQHAPVTIQALEAGRHVFCEKPVSLNRADALRMLQAQKKSGTFVQIGHCIRFWPEYQALEKFHRSGEGGRLLSLSLQRRCSRPTYSVGNWIQDEKRSLGAALDLHIHDTDFVLHLLGLPAAVSSRGTRDQQGLNHIFTHYHYPEIAVHAEGGWNYPSNWGFQMSFQALFENAAIEFDSRATPSLRITRGDAAPETLPFEPAGGKSVSGTGNISSLGGYANEMAYFIDCVSSNQAPAIATLSQAIESLETALCEIESVRTGSPVAVINPLA